MKGTLEQPIHLNFAFLDQGWKPDDARESRRQQDAGSLLEGSPEGTMFKDQTDEDKSKTGCKQER